MGPGQCTQRCAAASCLLRLLTPRKARLASHHISRMLWMVQVYLKRPQETEMWNDFASCVYAIREGERPLSAYAVPHHAC